MPTKIKLLPEKLANQIAAGEVVERPASVVKELLENALDAGARRVTVELEAGGRRLIRVADDGEGMGRDDCLLAFERHATSKISRADDLFAIATLGFRGEALPSIASVSRLELVTRERGSDSGTRVRIEAGTIKDVAETGAAPGTVVEVKDLFYNLPARRKFLKTQETELGHVSDWVSRIALAHPAVQFELLHNGRTLWQAPAARDLNQRLVHALGPEAVRRLVPADRTFSDLLRDGPIRVHGYVSRPEFTRAGGQGMYVYINGRFVRDRFINHAVHEAYRTLVPKGRYPVLALFLELPPSEVDVNVHPTKHEVRFREQAPVHQAVLETLRHALARDAVPSRPAAPTAPAATHASPESPPPDPAAFRQRAAAAAARYSPRPEPPPPTGREFRPPAKPLPAAPATTATAQLDFSTLEVIGQFQGMYVVAQSADALVLIDQHAAHERIAFERLRAELNQDGVISQALLFPETLELTLSEADLLQRNLPEIHRLGFEIEPFGGTTFAVKAVPALLGDAQPRQILADVLDELAGYGRSIKIEEKVDEVLRIMACHAVVRGPKNLSPQEIHQLLADMAAIPFSSRCPHGREAVFIMPTKELAKKFNR